MDNEKLSRDDDGNIRVAVKTLLSLDEKPADQEARILEMMRELQTDHLIKAVAYYRYDGKHHFMFPWAEHGNLWEFWTRQKGPRALEKPYLVWIFKQLTGLAAAIEKLHNQTESKNCRHGDLKPENILCFRQGDGKGNGPTPAVRMVITDVGLAKDHVVRTQLRESTNTKVSTKRYAGPEMDVASDAPLSRRFDIWSMGCILLEFLIWILYGGDELIKCTKAASSTFYRVVKDESGQVKSVEVDRRVQGWVSYIRKDWRCPRGTALELLLHLVTEKLLVVNVQEPPDPPSSITTGQVQARIYAPEMRRELEKILTQLEADEINAVGDRPSSNSSAPLGPSYAIPTTKGGHLAPATPSTRVRELLSHDGKIRR